MADTPADAFKKEGNAHFAKADYLKAAAAYTKAIKVAPTNHVLYSNRAQAFLKLNKVSKALEDADKCLSLDAAFVKGYHRKASALHALGDKSKSDAAVALLLSVIDTGMDDKDLVRLGVQIQGKGFVQALDAQRKANAPPAPEPEPAAEPPAPVPAAPKPAAPKAAKAAAKAPAAEKVLLDEKSLPPWKAEPEEFAAGCLQPILTEFEAHGLGSMPSVCFLQPSPPAKGATEEPQLGQINIKPAFASPTNLAQCSDFLRGQVKTTNARSAAIFVRKGSIEYPCVWKDKTKAQWAYGANVDGVFMQCESPTERVLYFTVLKEDGKGVRSIGESAQLDIDEFGLFPRLFGE